MKLKNLSLIAGAIALTLSATPFVVNAQPISQTATEVKPPHNSPFEQLGLTDAQKTQIKEIRRNSRTQMEAILTPEQKQQLEAAKQARQDQPRQERSQGERPKKGFASLNLTPEQKTKMREIKESEKNQIQAILTPEQQQQLKEFQDNRRSRRQQPNSGN
ncbi:MAG: P pilus assembly/Cpx signaling pathway, periplasmic inhibitor/zinc-resistance associated protein [Tolypothrix brevis GSE-NOS-MK-07-07A]|jgi:Spy/CpxP family protein refolding chaperone|nr:P pilus assembly/Cpx signaling pathway, periplasmic inhibitor/zinc-resistance associated protein [Tolypothrix brevis GSE-NOS-MK-07-07A]